MIVSTLFPVCTIILMSCIFIFTQKSALLCSVFFSIFSYTLSDTNLNYVQVLLFFVWGFSCCKVSSIFCIFSIDRSTSGNILDLTSSECSFLHMWMSQIGWDSVMRMSVDLRDLFLYEAFLYYNPLLLVVSFGYFILLRVDYSFIFLHCLSFW